MSNFKRYFIYHMRSNLIRSIIILVLSIVYLFNDNSAEFSTDFSCLSVVIGFMATLIPIFEFYTFKTKRNLDTYFSLPISRRDLALCHFLSGLIEMVCIFTASTVLLFISKLPFSSLHLIYFIPYYFCALGYGVLLYSFFTFVFNIGNTVIDGILMIILYIFAPFLIVGAAYFLCSKYIKYYIPDITGFIFDPLGDIAKAFEYLSDGVQYSFSMSTECIVFTVICIVLCISAFFAFLHFFKKTKQENIEGISESAFGYKTMIPVCGISIALMNFSFILTIILMTIGYIIYRRGFEFKRSDIEVFIIATIISTFW